ncbi:MAG: hypothetical protein IJW13_02990, partial [Clostridia bacterium]|nr:hypothetical protein [Clostridia bacterium]
MNETKTIRVYSDIPNVESFLNNLKQNKPEYENVQFEIIGLDQRENVLFNLNYDVVDLIIVDHATAKKLYQNCGEDIALITDFDTSPYQGSYLDDHLTEESSLYALPFTKNVAVLYVNDDLISLEEGAETSWSQFEEGQDLHLNGDNQSNTYAFFKPTNGEARILAYSTGNNLFNEESGQILTEGANKALTHIKNLNQAGLICPHPQDDLDQKSSIISQNGVAFIIGSTEHLNWLSQFEQAQFSAHPLPKNDDFIYDVDLGGFDIVIPAFLSEDDRAFVNQLALDMATGEQAVIAIGDDLKLIPALAQESELDSLSGITNFNQNVIKFMHGLVYGENTFHPQTSTKEYEIIQAFNDASSTIFEYNYSGAEAADVLYDSVERIINPPVATENTAVNIVNATNEVIYNSTATANAQTGEEIVIDLTVNPNGYSNISEAQLQLYCENTACEDCSLPVYTRTVNEQNEQQDRLIGYTKQSQDGNFTLIDLSGVIKEINEQTTFKMVIKGKDNQTLQVATQ